MVKKAVKTLIPHALLQWRTRKVALREQEPFTDKTPAQTFSEIYHRNMWGGTKGEFYSGDGSTEEYSEVYAQTIRNFIAENGVDRVVDLGCGDFRVASRFVSSSVHYMGCDVVPDLVEHLTRNFADETTGFRCVDMIEDDLPDGDLCLIRQVLQHLSNAEIAQVLLNVRKYNHIIITEHYPNPRADFVPNLDIPHGPNLRLPYGSAVVLDKPPFNLQNVQLLLDIEWEGGTRIKSFLAVNG